MHFTVSLSWERCKKKPQTQRKKTQKKPTKKTPKQQQQQQQKNKPKKPTKNNNPQTCFNKELVFCLANICV